MINESGLPHHPKQIMFISTAFTRLALAGLILTSASFANSHQAENKGTHKLCKGFLPENSMRIPVHGPGAEQTGISQAEFNQIMDRTEKIFGPVVAKAGGKLVVNRLWTDPTVNASAEQRGSNWYLNMYGGLARHRETTYEGMALVVCHELGHHLGGAPKYGGGWNQNEWATNEGGADYYAGLKCLRYFFAQDDNDKIVAKAKIDALAKQRCVSEFKIKSDQLICMRTSLGGASVAGLFMDLNGSQVRPEYSTPDLSEVASTNDEHPDTQCRMDTYLAGAVCHIDRAIPNSQTDFKAGSCVQGVDTIGWRPRCWFQPNENNQGGDNGWPFPWPKRVEGPVL